MMREVRLCLSGSTNLGGATGNGSPGVTFFWTQKRQSPLVIRPLEAQVAISAILVDLQRLLGGLDVDPVKVASLPEAHGAIRGNLQAGRTSVFVSPDGRQPT